MIKFLWLLKFCERFLYGGNHSPSAYSWYGIHLSTLYIKIKVLTCLLKLTCWHCKFHHLEWRNNVNHSLLKENLYLYTCHLTPFIRKLFNDGLIFILGRFLWMGRWRNQKFNHQPNDLEPSYCCPQMEGQSSKCIAGKYISQSMLLAVSFVQCIRQLYS